MHNLRKCWVFTEQSSKSLTEYIFVKVLRQQYYALEASFTKIGSLIRFCKTCFARFDSEFSSNGSRQHPCVLVVLVKIAYYEFSKISRLYANLFQFTEFLFVKNFRSFCTLHWYRHFFFFIFYVFYAQCETHFVTIFVIILVAKPQCLSIVFWPVC